MTQTMSLRLVFTVVGRKIRDCHDGEVLLIIGIDSDGDYVCEDFLGRVCPVDPTHVHSSDELHSPEVLFLWGFETVCYCWIGEV